MNEPYEELIRGRHAVRHGPDGRHEAICERLHLSLFACVTALASIRLLPPRAPVAFAPGNLFRPDLALVAAATGKCWLAAEVIDRRDHLPDTVEKKAVYEELLLPRLWMVDPRYDNVEIYHATRYGLRLVDILGRTQVLADGLLPGLSLSLAELFGPQEGAES